MLRALPATLTKLPSFDSSISTKSNYCGDDCFSISMLSMNKRGPGEMSIGCCLSENATPLKTRKLNGSYTASSVSSHSSAASPMPYRFLTLPRRSVSSQSTIPVLSPCTYLTVSLKNKKIKSRIDSFSLEQALYFEPYEESEIDMDLLKAVREGDLEKLRSLMNGKQKDYDLEARNQSGENLVHMACRVTGISVDVLKFLVDDAKVQLNVRDRFGRTPLHNACMSAIPNFNNIDYIMKKAPKLTVFEDDKNKVPFDLIPQRCFERWTRFLSEKHILPTLCKELSEHEGLSQTG